LGALERVMNLGGLHFGGLLLYFLVGFRIGAGGFRIFFDGLLYDACGLE
jgi:hypothetical protein